MSPRSAVFALAAVLALALAWLWRTSSGAESGVFAASPAGAAPHIGPGESLHLVQPLAGTDSAEEAAFTTRDAVVMEEPDDAHLVRALERLREFPHPLKGLVLDAESQPVDAHLDIVGHDGGSMSQVTSRVPAEKGLFGYRQERIHSSEFHLKATTEDGRVAVVSDLNLTAGQRNAVVMSVVQGATLELELTDGRERVRCAIFQGGKRHSDFTLRKNRPHTEVVPAGSNVLELYHGSGEDYVLCERRELELEAGRTQSLRCRAW